MITVLSFESLSHPDELIDFYVSEGVERVCFNVEEIEGLNRSSSLAVMGVETAFCEFFRRIIRRLGELKRPLWIREIASSLAAIAAPAHEFLRNPQIEPLQSLALIVMATCQRSRRNSSARPVQTSGVFDSAM